MNDTDTLVEQLANALTARGWTMATAESCTGGLIAGACTDRAGSSDWFERGFVTYSNAAKTDLLGVTATATCTGAWARAPAAMARATGSLTAPWAAMRSAGTPSKSVLAALE